MKRLKLSLFVAVVICIGLINVYAPDIAIAKSDNSDVNNSSMKEQKLSESFSERFQSYKSYDNNENQPKLHDEKGNEFVGESYIITDKEEIKRIVKGQDGLKIPEGSEYCYLIITLFDLDEFNLSQAESKSVFAQNSVFDKPWWNDSTTSEFVFAQDTDYPWWYAYKLKNIYDYGQIDGYQVGGLSSRGPIAAGNTITVSNTFNSSYSSSMGISFEMLTAQLSVSTGSSLTISQTVAIPAQNDTYYHVFTAWLQYRKFTFDVYYYCFYYGYYTFTYPVNHIILYHVVSA